MTLKGAPGSPARFSLLDLEPSARMARVLNQTISRKKIPPLSGNFTQLRSFRGSLKFLWGAAGRNYVK
jgi:hypothetical protein